jgi:hypothetical protein
MWEDSRTDIDEVQRIIGRDVTKMASSLVDLAGRLCQCAIGSDVLDGVLKIDELLGEITKLQTYERLPKQSISREVMNMTDETKEKN